LPIPANTPVILTKLDGLRAIVRPATRSELAVAGVATIGDRHLAAEPTAAVSAVAPAAALPAASSAEPPPTVSPEAPQPTADVPERSPA
jgi:hypothetical protein